MKSLGHIFLSVLCISAHAQFSTSKVFTKEIAITVDNDEPFMTDQYYTAGQDLYYRFLLNSKIPLLRTTDSTKSIFSIHYGNKVFNPKNLDTQDTQYMDRPYCGWNFISAELRRFNRKNVSNFFAFQVGMVGRESGMGQLQLWLHKLVNLYTVPGWDTQIRNEVVFNVNYNHMRAFQISKDAEFISSSGAWAGTGNNKLSQEFTLRLFQFNPLNKSSFTNANLTQGTSYRRHEFFFYVSFAGDYVFSNIFIQGSLFRDNPSPYTTSINPLLFTTKAGLQYSNRRISAGLSATHLSKETKLVSTHNYASASLAYRF